MNSYWSLIWKAIGLLAAGFGIVLLAWGIYVSYAVANIFSGLGPQFSMSFFMASFAPYALFSVLLLIVAAVGLYIGGKQPAPPTLKLDVAVSKNNASYSFCPFCGKELPPNSFTFCPFCGKTLKLA